MIVHQARPHAARERRLRAAAPCVSLLFLSLPLNAAHVNTLSIEPGRAAEATLAGGDTVDLDMALTANETYVLQVRQKGIDVVVEVFDPSRGSLGRADAPGERNAVERFLFEPTESTHWRASVAPRSPAAPPGGVEITLTALGGPALPDSPPIALARAFTAIGLRARSQAETEAAPQHARDALEIARSSGDSEAEATATFYLGALILEANRPGDAIEHFDAAARSWQGLGNVEMEGTAENFIGYAQALVHDFANATEHTRRAADLQGSLAWPYDAAMSRNNLCWILQEQGRLDEAAACYEARLSAPDADSDLGQLAIVHNNLSGISAARGDADGAIVWLEKALPVVERIGDPKALGDVHNNLAFAYRRAGEIQRAFDEFAAAIPYREAAADKRGLGITYDNMGFLLNLIGDPAGARSYLVAALSLAREAQNKGNETRVEQNLGNALVALGAPAEGTLHHERALALAQSISDRQTECRALTLLAGDRRMQGDVAAALDLVRNAVDTCAARTDLLVRALLLVEHGRVLAATDDPGARATIGSGLELFEQMHDAVGIASAHEALADLAQRHGDLALAIDEAHQAIDALESLRASIAATEQLARFTGVQRAAYDRAIALHLDRYAIDPAARDDLRGLELVAASRARTLGERLDPPETRITGLHDAAALKRYAELRRSAAQLANSYSAALEKGDQQEIERTDVGYRKERSQLERLEHQLFPAQRRAPSTKTVLSDLQSTLDEDAIVLVYWLGVDQSRVWAVTRAAVTSADLPASAEIETLVRRVYAFARNADRGSVEDAADRIALSHVLLDAVPGLDRFRDVYVSADGVLNYVPFAALTTPAVGTELLVERHRVASLPTLMRPAAQPPPAAEARAVIFADPVYGSHDARLTPGTAADVPAGEQPAAPLRSDLETLPRLVRSRVEADAVRQMVGIERSETFLDFEATRERLLAFDDPEVNILLVAAHARVRSDSNAASGIVLSLFDAQGNPRAGFVSYYDLLQIRRAPALVVLDGCDTGLGVDIRGEGPVGIARAFMYAGASQVISSLWPAGDRSSELLMNAFYRGLLAEGRAPAAALQQAQIELRATDQRFRPPHAWAGFTVAYRWPVKPGQSTVLSARVTDGSRDPGGS